MSQVVSFLSDFGTGDSYVAQVKARILSGFPGVNIVDITHEVDSFAVLSGAWMLFTAYACFPRGTIHLAVVDPGVGTRRGILVVKKAGHIFVGPDNGIFSFIYPADEVIDVSWRPAGPISPTFNARDVFAPVVVRLLEDPSCEGMGALLADPVAFDVSGPMVVHIDRFGTVVTNIECSRLQPGMVLYCGEMGIDRIARTFADIPGGGLALVCGSSDTIEIAANRQSAARLTGAHVGMPVRLHFAGPHI